MKCVSLTATGLDQITGDGQVFVDVMLLLRCSIKKKKKKGGKCLLVRHVQGREEKKKNISGPLLRAIQKKKKR